MTDSTGDVQSEDPNTGRPLFHSPLGLFPFQVEGAALTYWQWTETPTRAALMLYDTGLGKTVQAIATSAMLFEDGLVDHVLVVAEANKVLDWAKDDFPKFSSLNAVRYAGDLRKRKKILSEMPQVLVMSYETGRNDICEFKQKSNAVVGDKILSEALRGKRVAIVFDEFSRLRNRSAKVYIAWDYLLNRVLRRTEHKPRVLGLTATSVEKSPIDHWNAGRLLAPSLAGTVANFESTYIKTRDLFGNPAEFTALTPSDTPPGVIPLNQMFASITLTKKKTDPDIVDVFPSKMENPPTIVDLGDEHRGLYGHVEEIFSDESLNDSVSRQGFGLLRQIAGHPMSLLRSSGQFAKDIVAATSPAYLERIGSAKVDAMLDWQRRMEGQQTVIFTFYGGSILPYIEHTLSTHGYKVSTNHGSMSVEDRQRQQDSFKCGDTQIFLSSDAGAKGLNLGVGSGLLHYETPLLWSTFDQRSNRIHRLDSRHPSVTIDYLVARDTVEVAITNIMLKRNQWAEEVQDSEWSEDSEPSEGFLRAKDRLAMLRRAT